MATERITFAGADGHRLAARLDRPDGGPVRAHALFAHCFSCTKDVLAASRVAGRLAEVGIAVLRFDFTGLGQSEGDFANTNFSSNVADLVAAAAHMREHRQAPRLLIGHSLGGAAVLAAAAAVPEATAVVTVNAPADPAHLRRLFRPALPEIEARGEAVVAIGGSPFTIKKQLLDDIAGHRLRDAVADLRKALLVLHAPLDETVGIENAGLIFQAARHPKSFVALDGADHLLRRKEDARYAAEVIAAWAGRYLGPAPAAAAVPEPEPPAPPHVVARDAASGAASGLAQEIRVGRHRLRADEPVAVGGADTGPTPYDLLAAALGACTAMTLRLYAGRKRWPLERTTVEVRHGKIHAEDCADCETKGGARVDRFVRRLVLEGPLDPEQRARLLAIADKCPVHRTLEGSSRIETELAALPPEPPGGPRW